MTREDAEFERKWAELLYKEWEYRHGVYWKSLYLWGGSVIAVLLAPFLRAEFKNLHEAIYFFPLVGLILSLVGAWHLAAEAHRLSMVSEMYNELRKDFTPRSRLFNEERSCYEHAVTEKIASIISFLFTFGFTALAVVSWLFIQIGQKAEADPAIAPKLLCWA